MILFYSSLENIASRWRCLYILITKYKVRATRQEKPERNYRSNQITIVGEATG